MKFTAVGDMLLQRRFPGNYEGFEDVRSYIAQGDFRFCNLETTVNKEGECFGEQFSGGSWLRLDPEGLENLRQFGFNAVNCANNHSMDLSHTGLLKTMQYLREYGYTACGIGENLSQAAAPVYVDTPKGRIALIALTSLQNQPAALAGEQSRRMRGRPGVNGLRVAERFVVTDEQLQMISQIADATGVNIQKSIERAEGYFPPLDEGTAEFANLIFERGEAPGRKHILNAEDMARLEKSIYEASLGADYIMVSIHAHECDRKKDEPVDFLTEFARKCIDMGADAVIGHGPHLLRGVEIYRDRPIFYSLGDFVLQNENIQFGPEDFYKKYGITSNETMHELFDIRSNHFTRGLSTQRVMFETVIPYWEMQDKKLTHLELMPVLLTYDVPRSRYGMPQINKNAGIIERLAELSKPLGTEIKIKCGVGIIVE